MQYSQSRPPSKTKNYSCVPQFNAMYHNYRILQTIRELRKYLVEGFHSDSPSTDHLNETVDRFSYLQIDDVSSGKQARVVMRKVVTLFLAQFGFESKITQHPIRVRVCFIHNYLSFQ